MTFFLGIDGGASKTSCVVGDDRDLIGRGSGGSSNLTRVSEQVARSSMSDAIFEACRSAGILPSQVAKTCVGAAGSGREGVRDRMQRLVGEIVSGKVQVIGDMVVALHAAFGDGPGVIVIAGSGSIAYGRDSAGVITRAGGWGHAVSDEGSGYWIGKRAIAACLRICDERGDSEWGLLSQFMNALAAETHEELILKVNASPPPDFAALFPLMTASCNDETTREILHEAGEELAGLAIAVLKRMSAKPERRHASVAMAGGVFRNSVIVREAFFDRLREAFPGVVVNPAVVEPVLGALDMARKG